MTTSESEPMGSNPDCTLDLRVYEDESAHADEADCKVSSENDDGVTRLPKRKTKSRCYMLRHAEWERCRQKYRPEWETDPLFQGWIAAVSGDVHKARCLYCRVLVSAHYKDLKDHARTAKHAHNVALNQPGCVADPREPAEKPLLNRKRAFGPQRTTRFDALHKTRPLSVSGLNARDMEEEQGLLAPDDSLASHASLISMAVYPSGQPIPHNITTLVMPNTAVLDESIAASLLPTTPGSTNTMYRVKKLHQLATDGTSEKHRNDADSDDVNSMPSLHRAARGITLWEFLRLKVRQDSDRPNSTPRLALMISEFDALQQQLRTVVKDQLVPIAVETNTTHPDSKILVIPDEELAQSLGLKTGKYLIKQSTNESSASHPRPQKRVRKAPKEKQYAARPKNSSAKAGEIGNLAVGDSVMQADDLDELIDTQKLMEFAITTSNPRDASNFEPTQMLQSNYLEGPVIKIQEFPGSMPGISEGSSAAEDDVLLRYMSQSAGRLPGISNGADENSSFKPSLMVTSAAGTQPSTLTFPLTLAVDASTLDSCSALQFS